ncbi:glycosyltransferase [Gelidibacter sp. F2691]|nr:glycosyltransferase [Gelidibacter sp. F2691]
MKNILIIEPSGLLYGSEMVLLDIISNTNSGKYNYTVVLPQRNTFSKLLEAHNINFVELLNISSPFKKLISYVKLYQYIKNNKPDMIFVNQAGIQKVISHIANVFKIPVVSEISTLEDGLLVSKFKSKLHKQVKTYICNSDFIASKVDIPSEKKAVLYYGYEWKQLNPIVNTQKNPFRIALLGRISESKGHFLLVEAIADLVKRRSDINLEVYFIGDAPHPSIEKNIKSIIHSYGLDNLFIFRGFQTNIEQELNNMNIMVIPSIQEPFGRIYCESAEAKLPCIVANSGGLGELAKRFNLGIQFEAKNANDLGLKIEYSYDNYEQIRDHFQNEAHSILHRLDKREYIRQIETIFDNALENRSTKLNWYGTQSKA